MLSNYKPTKEQKDLIKQLSKETEMSENEIMQFLIEMGISFCIAIRKGKENESLKLMHEKVQNNSVLNRICQRLENWWSNGS